MRLEYAEKLLKKLPEYELKITLETEYKRRFLIFEVPVSSRTYVLRRKDTKEVIQKTTQLHSLVEALESFSKKAKRQ